MNTSQQQKIDDPQQQLVGCRREFAHYLQQGAKYGRADLPSEQARRISELREQIQQIKQALQALGVPTEDTT